MTSNTAPGFSNNTTMTGTLHRVVVTGMGVTCPIGKSVAEMNAGLTEGKSGVVRIPEWELIKELRPLVGGRAAPVNEKIIPRKNRRTMGPEAMFAIIAAEEAILDAGITKEMLPDIGISVGSTLGSPTAYQEFFFLLKDVGGFSQHKSGTFPKTMSHTCAANMAIHFGVKGRVQAPCSACTSGSQSIGLAYEAIRLGSAEIMLSGGADELHATAAGVFDIIASASVKYNRTPSETPRPFDQDRDGMVVGEGSGILVLESLQSALRRGARIYAEITGYTSTCDGDHMTTPSIDGIKSCISLSMKNSNTTPGQIDFISAHATGTVLGDSIEAGAYRDIFGNKVPIAAHKSYMGHTFGASGAIESIICILSINNNVLYPTLHLKKTDETCTGIQHVTHIQNKEVNIAMNNNFAFGGINTSLVFKKYTG